MDWSAAVGLGAAGVAGIGLVTAGLRRRRESRLFRAARAGARRLLGPLATSDLLPFGVHRHVPEVYAAAWVLVRELYLADQPTLTRLERELVALGVSMSNQCYYCTHNHAALVAVEGRDALEALRAGVPEEIGDPRLRAIALFAMSTKQPDAGCAAPPGTAVDARITAVAFHYVNRVMDALGPKGMTLELTAKPPSAIIAMMLRYHGTNPPGEALRSLRDAGIETPADVSPTDREALERLGGGRRDVADAATVAWSWIQQAARSHLPGEVLATIRGHLDDWRGEDAQLAGPWLDEAVVGLQGSARALARQGILVARESFRVDPTTLAEACGHDPKRALALVSFSAFAAALRISRWLPPER